MPMMMSQILKFADFTKTQRSRYLENETLFFLQIKKFINYSSRATLWQKKFVAEVTFKRRLIKAFQCILMVNLLFIPTFLSYREKQIFSFVGGFSFHISF